MPDPKTIRKAEPKDVVMCKTCTDREGHEVYLDRSALKKTSAGSGVPWESPSKPTLNCPTCNAVIEEAPAS